jgi:uncharacterized membrane protein YebE (DUF533 family)
MSDNNHLLTAVKLWAAAAWADGVVVEAEAMTMRAIIAAAKLTEQERALASTWLEVKVSLEDVGLAKIPRDERLHIYSVACGVAAMDQDVAAAERAFLDRLGKALQLDDADARKARTAAGL